MVELEPPRDALVTLDMLDRLVVRDSRLEVPEVDWLELRPELELEEDMLLLEARPDEVPEVKTLDAADVDLEADERIELDWLERLLEVGRLEALPVLEMR